MKCLESYPRSAAQQIANVVKTKSAKQVTSHAQKFYEKLDRYYEKPSVKGQEETKNALKRAREYFVHVPRVTVFKSLQPVISYYVTNNIDYTCDTSEHRIELGPRMKLGKCAICPYVRYMDIDYKEIT